jgi:hypothetical protein
MEHIFTSRYLLAGDAEDPNALVNCWEKLDVLMSWWARAVRGA